MENRNWGPIPVFHLKQCKQVQVWALTQILSKVSIIYLIMATAFIQYTVSARIEARARILARARIEARSVKHFGV